MALRTRMQESMNILKLITYALSKIINSTAELLFHGIPTVGLAYTIQYLSNHHVLFKFRKIKTSFLTMNAAL
jgi:hypothetical protein